jgi:pimeloyl-ACP methyl ester carboxylesterase
VQELYRHHSEWVAILIFADSYAGWKGSLPAEEVKARIEGVRKMLAAEERYDPPGLFAGEPPSEIATLLEEMTITARPASLAGQLFVMAEADERDLLPRIAVPTLLIWGYADTRSPLSVARQFENATPGGLLGSFHDRERILRGDSYWGETHPPRLPATALGAL